MRIKYAISLALSVLLLPHTPLWAADFDMVLVASQAHTETVDQSISPQVQLPPQIATTLTDGAVEPAGAVVVQPPADLWERIRIGFALAEMDTPLVQEHENWYANRPDYVRRMVDRSQRYLFYIVEEVEKRGMPTEVALLPMIESAFNPKAYSTAHASGIWQFIPSTGKNFGLQQNWWYDGRRDITAATGAALDYLQKLYGMFGSWEHALAAYNWGEGNMQRAINRNEAKGLPTDFLSLRMPAETRNYLPKLLAVKHVIANPQAFGLDLASIPNQPYFTKVATGKHIDVALAARLAETPADEFASLNPGHNRPVINSKDTEYLLLPADKADIFASNLESYDKPLVSWQSYKLGRGEKLDTVARKFSISVLRLKEVNSIGGHRKLAGGTLLVPLGADGTSALASNYAVVDEPEAPAVAGKKVAHVVRKGDTLPGIARRYAVSQEQIKALNHLKSNRLALGQKLVVMTPPARKLAAAKPFKPVNARAPAKTIKVASKAGVIAKSAAKSIKPSRTATTKLSATRHTVRRGDTLSSIAKHYNVAVNDIQRSNNLSAKRPLNPGSKVIIPGNS